MLDRRELVRRLLVDRGDLLVVSGLGSATYDVAAAGDHPLNFYLWGAMGGTAMIGLGLALAQPQKRVAVLTGDGDMLMGFGSLATIGVKQPKNLAIVVLDNAHYGETGMQASHTHSGIDLVATALGLRQCQAEPDHRGAAHRAPEVEVLLAVTEHANVVGGGAQSGDDQEVAGIAQQDGGDIAAIEGAVIAGE